MANYIALTGLLLKELMVTNYDKLWYVNDKLHRTNGHAVDNVDGSNEWWLNGVRYTEKKFHREIEERKINEKLHTTLDENPSIKKPKK